MRNAFVSLSLLLAVACCAWAQSAQSRAPQTPDFDKVEIHVLPVQGNVYMLVGAGGNITLQIGDDGVLLVDTGLAQNTEKVVAAIRTLSNKPIRYIINTHVHPDHVGGNEAIGKLGSTIAGGNISAGDLFVTTTYPFIDGARGGNITGIIAALNNMLDIAIPKAMQEGGTYIIPGHGRLTDEADLLEYRDMITIIRDRVQDGVKKGQTLDQVKAAKFTLDYDARWGATSGAWTTDMFIEAVYKDLSKANEPAKPAAAKAPVKKK